MIFKDGYNFVIEKAKLQKKLLIVGGRGGVSYLDSCPSGLFVR